MLRKVLIVDDEVDLAHLSAMLLEARGFNVVTANSAREALTCLGSDTEIDAVVSDVVMPGMNGLDLADAITDAFPQVKIVLVSGFTLPSRLDYRKRRYLFTAKPYDTDDLIKLLQT